MREFGENPKRCRHCKWKIQPKRHQDAEREFVIGVISEKVGFEGVELFLTSASQETYPVERVALL